VMRQCERVGEARSGRSGWAGFWEAEEKLAQCHLSVLFHHHNPSPPLQPPHPRFYSCSCCLSSSSFCFTILFVFYFIRFFFIFVISCFCFPGGQPNAFVALSVSLFIAGWGGGGYDKAGVINRSIQWVPGALSLGIKWPGLEADHSPPYASMAWC
jgi:hypothetical protein